MLEGDVYSPSLVSMMVHSLGGEARMSLVRPSSGFRSFDSPGSIARELKNVVDNFANAFWPSIPVVGQLARGQEIFEGFRSFVDHRDSDRFRFLWGRVPLNVLVSGFNILHAVDPNKSYMDLGTPVYRCGSGSQHDTDCATLLTRSAHHATSSNAAPARVGAAIIDLGDAGRAPPDDYGGKLRHAVNGAGLSDHAEMVLSALLHRLDTVGTLSDAAVSCALVVPPSGGLVGIGRSCFDQATTSEIFVAAQALDALTQHDPVPTIINMSLGTHVGPHNGNSPLEAFISGALVNSNRFVFVAAGNEDRIGCTAKRELLAGEDEILSINTGPACSELLVEFWWKEPSSMGLAIAVDMWEVDHHGTHSNVGSFKIDGTRAGAMMTGVSAGLPNNIVASSLFSAKCQGDFGCVAFAVSESHGTQLPQMKLNLTLSATTDLTLNAWIVICEAEPVTALIGGASLGTMTVPATDPSVISVAGLEDRTGRVWKGSSRGPAASYDAAPPPIESPLMAHIAAFGAEFGTSFASPRAGADATAALLDPVKRPHCTDAASLVEQTYNLTIPLATWHPRVGYHRQTT